MCCEVWNHILTSDQFIFRSEELIIDFSSFQAEPIASKLLPLAGVVSVAAICTACLDPSLAFAADTATTCAEVLASDSNPNAIYLVFCIAEFIALTGAAVGG